MNKIIFAGTPEISAGVLQALIAANHKIIACLTQPDRPQGRGLKLTPSAVKVQAQENNIPVLQPLSLKNAEAQQQLRELQPDLMIVMAYGLILPQAVLDIPKLGCINLHASILPRWRGAAPIQHAILAGDNESGITIMQMDAGLDTGDILDIYPCKIFPQDTSENLHNRLAELAKTSCLSFLKKLDAGQIKSIKQDNSLATYAHKIDKAQAHINWNASAIEIDRMVRAYTPWPVAFTYFMQQAIRIWKTEVIANIKTPANTQAGTILAVNNQGIQVATGDGVINLLVLQFPGKKPLPIADIYHANKNLTPGIILS